MPLLCLRSMWGRLSPPTTSTPGNPFHQRGSQPRAQHQCCADSPSLPGCEIRVCLKPRKAQSSKQRAVWAAGPWLSSYTTLQHFSCRPSVAFREGRKAVTPQVLQSTKPPFGEHRDRTALDLSTLHVLLSKILICPGLDVVFHASTQIFMAEQGGRRVCKSHLLLPKLYALARNSILVFG